MKSLRVNRTRVNSITILLIWLFLCLGERLSVRVSLLLP